jgi:hypothetical protein
VPSGIIEGVVTALGEPELALRVMAGLGEVDLAAPSWAMWDLGRVVAGSPLLREQVDQGVPGLLERLRSDQCEEARRFVPRFDDFLYAFGSRGPDEWDLASATWETHLDLALGFIDRMRLADAANAPQNRFEELQRDRQQAIHAVLDRLAGEEEATAQFQMGLRAIDAWLPARERSKTTIIRMFHEGRVAVREIARRTVEQGHLDQVEDFSMLTLEEFEQFLEEPAAWSDTVRSRLARYEELESLMPPFIVVGACPPPSTWERRVESLRPAASAGDVLEGIAGCPGRATGTARSCSTRARGPCSCPATSWSPRSRTRHGRLCSWLPRRSWWTLGRS